MAEVSDCRDGLMAEASDPTIGPGNIKAEASGPTTGRDDKKGDVLCGEGKGETGLRGKFARLGSSVPILRLTVDHLSIARSP